MVGIWSSPTGPSRLRQPDFGLRSSRPSGPLPRCLRFSWAGAVALGSRLAWIVLAAVYVVVLALAFPGYPVLAFSRPGDPGSAGLTFFGGAELKDWREQTQGFAETRFCTTTVRRGARAGFFWAARKARTPALCRMSGFRRWWAIRRRHCCAWPVAARELWLRLAGVDLARLDQLLRFGHRRADVFRHPDECRFCGGCLTAGWGRGRRWRSCWPGRRYPYRTCW